MIDLIVQKHSIRSQINIIIRRISIIVLFFLAAINLHAQNSGTIRGVLRDANSGEILAYGNVYIEELHMGTSTDERGNFLLPSIPAKSIVSCEIYGSYREFDSCVKNNISIS